MPFADSQGVKLYYEETGRGTPIVFVHEYADDVRGWEAQVRHFSRRYRCVTFNARGYPPSDVPKSAAKYSQRIATDDIAAVMRHLGIRKAHIVGCSMGGYATLHFGIHYPRMALSLTVLGAGFGSDADKRRQFMRDSAAMAQRLIDLGMRVATKPYAVGPSRVQFQNKDPRGWREFAARFAEHSALGAANTLKGVQMRRPTVYQLAPALKRLKVPTHILSGDEDDNCLEPGIFIKRTCAASVLSVVAGSGHAVNLEEPALFNRIVGEFIALVDSGRWRPQDPRSKGKSTLSNKG